MNNDGAEFTPEQAEQQIDLLARPWYPWANPSPEARLVSDLYQVCAEDDTILENAWQRLAEQVTRQQQEKAAGNATQQSRPQSTTLPGRPEGSQNMQRTETRAHSARQSLRFLQVCALLLIVASLVVGTTFVITTIRQNHTTGTSSQVKIPSSTEGVYISTPQGVYREDLTTGKVIWHYTVTQQFVVVGTVSVIDHVAVFQLEDENKLSIVGVDPATGKQLWKTEENPGAYELLTDGSNLILTIIHKTSEAGIANIIAYYARTGSQAWSYKPVPDSGTLPANLYNNETIANGVLYLVYGPQVFAIRTSSGQLLWRKTLPPGFADNAASKPAVSGDRLYFSDYKKVSTPDVILVQGWLFALDATSGNLIWHVLTKYTKESVVNFAPGPAVIGNVLYISGSADIPQSTGNILYAYNISNGALLPNAPGQGHSIFPAPVALQNLLIYGLPRGNTYNVTLEAFNPVTRSNQWTAQVAFSPNAVQGIMKTLNNVVYVTAYPRILAYSITGRLLQSYATQAPAPLRPNFTWSYSVFA